MSKNGKSAGGNHKKTSTGKRVTKTIFSTIGKTILTVFLICVITGCIVATAMAIYVIKFAQEDPEINLRDYKMNYTSIMYANDPETGEPYELIRLHGEENRIWVDLEQIPEHVQNAFIAIEDHTFREHAGVNWQRTFAAFLNEILHMYGERQGGSTITQQLIKNITGDNDISAQRKIKEIIRAIKLEKSYSKDDILEAYLNTIHLGNSTDGVQAAANLYFDKDISELTLMEGAVLAGITREPSYYEPIGHPENAIERGQLVLERMLEYGFITQAEYDEAMSQELVFTGEVVEKEVNSYFIDMVFEDVLNDLVERCGYTEAAAENLIYRGGLRIYTTIDETIQDKLEEIYLRDDLLPYIYPTAEEQAAGEEHQQLQSATIVMDYDGQIKGVVGGLGEKTGDRELNRATMSLRQPGSTMKPIGVYGPAIEYDLITWSSIFEDSPAMQIDGKDYPVNYYGSYDGDMTIEEALCRSVNTVAVKVEQILTPQKGFDFVTKKLGITTLVGSGATNDIDVGPMALGGVTNGVSVRELTAAYQVFGNGGMYNKPISYTRVLDYQGNVILENEISPTRALTVETATVMNKLLQRNVTNGTGTSVQFGGWQLAGKTGTTNDDKDYWWIGMSPYYVMGTWVGFDIPESYHYGSNGHPALRIWRTCMTSIHEGLEQKSFPVLGNVVERTYCMETGGIATEYCPETGTGWYKASNVPSTCTEHYEGWTPEDEESDSSGGSIWDDAPSTDPQEESSDLPSDFWNQFLAG